MQFYPKESAQEAPSISLGKQNQSNIEFGKSKSLNQAKGGGNSNTNSNGSSNKSFNTFGGGSQTRQQKYQPVLKNDQRQTGPQLKKQGSGPVEKKAKAPQGGGSKQPHVFSYEERHSTSGTEAKGALNTNMFKRRTPLKEDDQQIEDEDKALESQEAKDSHVSDGQEEQRFRPSDEVRYVEYNDSGKSIVDRNSIPQQHHQPSDRGTTSSFTVIDESLQKKNIDRSNDKFAVINEDAGDSKNPYENNLNNSDLKRFNIDDDNQQDQFLRIGQQQNQNKPVYFTSEQNVLLTRTEDQSRMDTTQELRQKLHESSENMQRQQHEEEKSIPPQYSYDADQHNEATIKNHMLSFADQNQLYQVEYPPLQQPPQISNQSAEKEMQQRRLNEILKTSQSDISVLQNSHQQIDEKSLNNMIDQEKNYVILQYERILSQLNVEFHKLLSKVKENEEQLASKDQTIQTQGKIISDKEEQQFQQEQINQQLSTQVSELLQELERLTYKNQASQHEASEGWNYEKAFLEQKVQTLQNKLRQAEAKEAQVNQQLEFQKQRVINLEKDLRSKEEELFQASKDSQNYQRDFKNIKDLEHQLKQEIQFINSQRLNLENELQDTKQQLCQIQIQIRQKDVEINNLDRSNRSLAGTIEIQQNSLSESMTENNMLKEQITEYERVKLQMRNHIEKQNREMQNLQHQLRSSQNMQEQEGLRVQQLENHYKKEIQRLIENQKQQAFQPNIDVLKHKVSWADDVNQSLSDDYSYQTNSQLNNTVTFQNQKDMQKPLQETHNTYYSPQRNHRMQVKQHQSPGVKADTHKNTIAWPFLWGSQGQQNNNSHYQQNQVQSNHNFNQYQIEKTSSPAKGANQMSDQRRRTIDQNQSQLHDVLTWGDHGQNSGSYNRQQPYNQGAKSLERNDQLIQQEKPKYPPPKGSQIYQTWNQSHMPQRQQYQDQDLQPAGKKSSVPDQSPLKARSKNYEQQVAHLQNSLSALQMDKERIENEYRKMGNPKNKQQIEKKKEIETEVEIVNRNIQNLKQKLREMNAL